MSPKPAASDPPLRRIRWQRLYRIIVSRYPPVDLFERRAPPEDWEHLAALEMLTNPRLRQEWGEISLVPPDRRVAGPGASWVMAPFVHPTPGGSRFSDGRYGVYYGARAFETAVAETVFHQSRQFADAPTGPEHRDMRVLVGGIDARLRDIAGDQRWADAHRPDDYGPAQQLGARLRDGGANGIHYDSVRHAGGRNVAAFWPDVVSIPSQERHLRYEWDGSRIHRYFDFQTGMFTALEG
ncbi:MAG: RES family NAD+ phosphorylase [Inquilinaceae bacterium]